eukprot:scaffold674361_cov59-Prasinocladus_malaysianus.AAC.2
MLVPMASQQPRGAAANSSGPVQHGAHSEPRDGHHHPVHAADPRAAHHKPEDRVQRKFYPSPLSVRSRQCVVH